MSESEIDYCAQSSEDRVFNNLASTESSSFPDAIACEVVPQEDVTVAGNEEERFPTNYSISLEASSDQMLQRMVRLWGISIGNLVLVGFILVWTSSHHELMKDTSNRHKEVFIALIFGMSQMLQLVMALMLFAALCIRNKWLLKFALKVYLYGSRIHLVTICLSVASVIPLTPMTKLNSYGNWQRFLCDLINLCFRLCALELIRK